MCSDLDDLRTAVLARFEEIRWPVEGCINFRLPDGKPLDIGCNLTSATNLETAFGAGHCADKALVVSSVRQDEQALHQQELQKKLQHDIQRKHEREHQQKLQHEQERERQQKHQHEQERQHHHQHQHKHGHQHGQEEEDDDAASAMSSPLYVD